MKNQSIPAMPERGVPNANGALFRHPYLFTLLACLGSAFLFDYSANGLTPYALALIGLAFAFLTGLGIYWAKNGVLTEERIAFLIIAASFLVKLIYVICTGLGERQHDVGTFKESSIGHAGRIFRTMDGELFPEAIRGQGYHPPLHYMLEALWLKFLTWTGYSVGAATRYATSLTLFYSCSVTLVCRSVIREFRFGKGASLCALSLIAFHPTFIILAASYNNDLLSILLLFVALLYAVRWFREPTFRNIFFLALGIGLGMMSKLSAGYIAPAVAMLFLIKFISEKKSRIRLIGEYCAFGAVCVPLGTWWSFYMLIAHDKPLGYVMKLSDKLPQYIGFRSVAERLFGIAHSFSEGIWFARGDTDGFSYTFYEYNIPSAVVKTSAFGEWEIGKGSFVTEFLAYALIILNVALILFSLWCMARLVRKKLPGWEKEIKLFLYVFWATVIVMYVKFCFDFPHNCTMDFRYIVPTAVIGAVFIGAYADIAKSKALKTAVYSVCGAFCVISALLYVLAA